FTSALLSPFGTLPQVGNNLWTDEDGTEIEVLDQESIAFPYSGFYVQRSDFSEEADYLFFYGARELIGHATAGGNSIQLAAMGDQLLVSGGRPNYFDDAVLYPNSKDYLAEPSSYKTNTVLVDGYSQKIAVTFDGAHEDPLAGRWLDSDHFDYVEGVWDLGYVNHKNLSDTLDSNVAHQRKVIYLEDESIWIVVDTMTAEQAHEFTQVWKLAPPEVTDDVQTGGFTPDQVATQENQNAILASGITDDSTSLRIQQFGADFTYETHYGEDGGDYGYYGSLYSGEPDFSVDVHATFAPVSEADQNSVSVISILQSFQGAEAGVSYQDVSQGGTAGVVLEFASGRTLEIAASPELRDLSVAGVEKSDVDLLIVDRFGDEKAILVTGDPNDTSASYQIADDQRIEIRSPETFAWDVADNGAATPQILNDPDSAISAYFQVGAQAHWDQHIGSLSAGDTIFADETAGGYAIDLRDSGTADVMLRTREAPYQADIATVISSGSSGHDTILGGQNADVIAGGQGVDRLAGREGADIFVFASDAGSKIIYDFTDGEDLIFFDGVDFAEVTVADYRDDHTLLSHGDTRMILRDFDHSDFSHSNTADTLDI
ncbi:MAG: heparinase II/III family protein, partial [Pseudomonadota bacterium]